MDELASLQMQLNTILRKIASEVTSREALQKQIQELSALKEKLAIRRGDVIKLFLECNLSELHSGLAWKGRCFDAYENPFLRLKSYLKECNKEISDAIKALDRKISQLQQQINLSVVAQDRLARQKNVVTAAIQVLKNS